MKHLLSMAVLMVITISVASAGQQTTTSCDAYSAGCSFYTQGDTISAMKCFQKAAKAGNADGQYVYGLIKMGGFGGVKVNQKAGLRMIKQAAKNGESAALCFLGALYESGEYGQPIDKAKALNLYKKASRAGSLDGHIACGDTYWENGDTALAIQYWTKAAEEAIPYFVQDEQRDALARITYNLGWFSQNGIYQGLYEATDYYQLAVQYGDTKDAAFQLGMIALDDEDNPNQCLAAYYFTLAAEAGNSEAYVYLGHIERLNGTDEQALIYYLAAAHEGSANGIYCVASLYYERDEYDSTLYWASKCKDSALAEYLLGLTYYSLGDYAQAKVYWKRCVYKYHLDDAITMLKQLESGEYNVGNGLVEL